MILENYQALRRIGRSQCKDVYFVKDMKDS
jgi:serine/threonine protein kinase